MQYRHRVIIGDWSDDGHGKCDNIEFSSNLTREEIQDAYEKAKAEHKVDFALFCNEYEDDKLPDDVSDRLKNAGIDVDAIRKEGGDFWYNDQWDTFGVRSFFLLLMEFIKCGNPNFVYIPDESAPYLKLGNSQMGYGLYY